jgi:hypothetical protein
MIKTMKQTDVFILKDGQISGLKPGFLSLSFCFHDPANYCYYVLKEHTQHRVAMYNMKTNEIFML